MRRSESEESRCQAADGKCVSGDPGTAMIEACRKADELRDDGKSADGRDEG